MRRKFFPLIVLLFLTVSFAYAQSNTQLTTSRLSFKEGATTKSFINWNGSLLGLFNNETGGNADILLRANDDISFETNGAIERMRILDNGRVGIGLDNPSSEVEIFHNSTSSAAHLELTENQSNDFARLKFKNSDSDEAFWDVAGRASVNNSPVLNFFYKEDANTFENILAIDGKERNVNIGTSSNTSAKLYVYNDGDDAGGNRNYAIWALSDQTSTAPRYGVYGRAQGEGTGAGEGLKYGVYGFAGTSDNTKIGLYGFAGGGDGTNFGVYGLAGKDATNNYAIYGDANSNFGPTVWAGYFAGDVFTTGSYQPSDRTLKTEIKSAPSSLERLNALNIKTYKYSDKVRSEITLDGRVQTGFIAQDVEQQFPELVKKVAHPLTNPMEQEEGKAEEFLEFTGVNYVGFIPHLTNAIQEQQEQIEELQATNEALMNRLAKIEAMLAGTFIEDRTETVRLTNAELKQNAPNPFTQHTQISYFIPETVKVASLQITDLNGKVLKNIVIDARGNGQVELQAQALSAGNYTYSLVLDGKILDTKKMVLTK